MCRSVLIISMTSKKPHPMGSSLSRPPAVTNRFSLLCITLGIFDTNLINQTNMIKLINMPNFCDD